MSPALTLGALAYRAAVQLYPPAFRREFADEMTRDFVQATREAAAGPARGVLGLWLHVTADFIVSVVLQWIQTGLPIVALIAGAFSFTGIGLTMRLLIGRSWDPRPVQQDGDLLVFFLLVMVVLMVIVATICLTLWSTRRFLNRARR